MAIIKLRYIDYSDMFDENKLNDKKYVFDTLKDNINYTLNNDLNGKANFIKSQYAVVSFDTNIDGRQEMDFSHNLNEYKHKQCFIQEFYEISDDDFNEVYTLNKNSFSLFLIYKNDEMISTLPSVMKNINSLMDMVFDETDFYIFPKDLI